jgi:hypothetical protein
LLSLLFLGVVIFLCLFVCSSHRLVLVLRLAFVLLLSLFLFFLSMTRQLRVAYNNNNTLKHLLTSTFCDDDFSSSVRTQFIILSLPSVVQVKVPLYELRYYYPINN